MAIALQKPLGTDIYNIGVHNSNSTKIEQAVNQLQTDVTNIQAILPQKLNYKQVNSLNLNAVEGDTIYFVTGAVTTDVPVSNLSTTGGHVVLVYQYGTLLIKTLFTSDGRIFQKNSSDNLWKALTATVIDNLITDDSLSSLSARQGKILKDTKLDITFVTSNDVIDVDAINISGVFIGTNPPKSVAGKLPETVETLQNFVLVSYGSTSTICAQQLYMVKLNTCFVRYGYNISGNEFGYTNWVDNNSQIEGFDAIFTQFSESINELTERMNNLEKKPVWSKI